MRDGADRGRARPHPPSARLTGDTAAPSSFRLPAAAGAAALTLYALTCARTVSFGDSGELIAASWRFGIAHPPGYPIYTLLAGAVLHLVPFGEPAFRTNLLSALFAAAACGVIGWWANATYRSTAAALAAAGAFATCGIVWSVATITEVYALHALLLTLLLAFAWQAGDAEEPGESRRALLKTAIVLGIGLAHHPTIVVALPAAAVLAWPGRRAFRRRDIATAIAIAVLVPTLADLTLLLRSKWDPDSWGGVDSLPRLAAHAMASRYRLYDLGWGALARPEGWKALTVALWEGFAGVGLLAGIGGALVPSRRTDPGDRTIHLALLLLAAGGTAFVLRYATEDPDSYAIPIVIAVAMLAGRAMNTWETRLPKTGARVAPVGAAILLSALPLGNGWRAHDLSHDRAARLAAEDMLATLPPNAILFADGDDAFLLAYVTQVLNERPDATIYDRSGGLFRNYLTGAPREEPGAVDEEGRMHREIEIATQELQKPDGRPIFFMGWPGYELPAAMKFEPQGLFERVVRADAKPEDDAPLWARYHEGEIADSVRRDPGAFAASIAATYPLMRGEEALTRGKIDDARKEFDAALAIAKDNETVLNTIGTTWARRGNLRDAVAMFERATIVKPASLRAWLNLSQAYTMMGDANGAAYADGKARALTGANP